MRVGREATAELFEQDMRDSEHDVLEEVEAAFMKECEVTGNDDLMPVLGTRIEEAREQFWNDCYTRVWPLWLQERGFEIA